jgi:hypothetical protein
MATYRSRHTNTWFRAHRAITKEINDRVGAQMARDEEEAAQSEGAEFEAAVQDTVRATLNKQIPFEQPPLIR